MGSSTTIAVAALGAVSSSVLVVVIGFVVYYVFIKDGGSLGGRGDGASEKILVDTRPDGKKLYACAVPVDDTAGYIPGTNVDGETTCVVEHNGYNKMESGWYHIKPERRVVWRKTPGPSPVVVGFHSLCRMKPTAGSPYFLGGKFWGGSGKCSVAFLDPKGKMKTAETNANFEYAAYS